MSTRAEMNNRSTGLIFALFLLSCSFPAPWIFIGHATLDAPFAARLNGIPVTITGFNGHLSFSVVRLPVCVVIAFGVSSLVLLLLNQREITAVPRFPILVPWFISALGVGVVLLIGVFAP